MICKRQTLDLDEVHTFVCDICNMLFATKRKVAQHITQSHNVHSINQNVPGNKLPKINLDMMKFYFNISVNGTSTEANKTIYGFHFESVKETDNNDQIAPKDNNEYIKERQLFNSDSCPTLYNN